MRNKRNPWRILAAILLGLMASVTACSAPDSLSGRDRHTENRTVSSQRAGKTTNTPTLNLSWCTAKQTQSKTRYTRTVQFISPIDKAGKTVHFAHQPVLFDAPADCRKQYADGREIRSSFSKDFSLMAAQLSNEFTGNYHIGVIEGNTKTTSSTVFKDLSGLKSGDLTNKQTQGAFGPDGKLYYGQKNREGSSVYAVNPLKPNERSKYTGPMASESQLNPRDRSQTLFFLPGDKRPYSTDFASDDIYAATSTDGTWQIAYNANYELTYGNPAGKLHTVNAGSRLYPVAIDPDNRMTFIGWNGDNKIVRATINNGKVSSKTLLFDGENEITELRDIAVNPGGTHVAYIIVKKDRHAKFKSTGLYTMPLNGNGGPSLIKDLTDFNGYNINLLSWE